jgi:hypothetical protein
MYGTPYLKYREFETFEDVSKFLVNKGIVNYSIFKKLEDKEEVEMIYRDNDIRYLENEIKRLNNIIKEAINYIDDNTYYKDHKGHINIDDLYIILKGVDK